MKHHMSRRAFMALAGAGASAVLLPAQQAYAADAYADLRTRWAERLTGGAINPADPAYATALGSLGTRAQGHRSTLQTNTGRTELWPDLPLGPSHPSANVTASFGRLRTMALAQATPGTSQSGDTVLATQIADGLSFLANGIYRPGQAVFGNGWDWNIGAPSHLADAATLVYPSLSSAQISAYCASIDHFDPDVTLGGVATGANLADMCRIYTVRGALQGNSAKIGEAATALTTLFPYATSGDGLYPSGSYVFHNGRAYNGTYGIVHFAGIGTLLNLLAGSPWTVTDPGVRNVYDSATTAITPFVRNGLMFDSVRGRAISRADEPDAADGNAAALVLLDLATATAGTDPARAAELRGIAKRWLGRNTAWPITAKGDVASIRRAKSVLDDSGVPEAAQAVGHRQFPEMDRVVHHRPSWSYSISMCSKRTAYYESINGENKHGWHTAEGMAQLYLDNDPAQYNDAFWNTVFAKKLPGTTVDLKDFADSEGASDRSAAAWAGGAVVQGAYGAVGLNLDGLRVTLNARKSWFCFDDCVAALGAGITSTDSRYINTIIENRRTTAALTVDGTVQPNTGGWSGSFSAAQWAHIDGVAGYVFPGGMTIGAYRSNLTGSWSAVNASGPTTPDTRQYVLLQRDHGTNPAGAGYAYVLLPGFTAAQTAARASAPTVSVLANTADVQAVSHSGLGITMANFFAAGSAGPITVDKNAASVVMREQGGTLTVGVSDPTRAHSTVDVTIARSGYVSATPGPGVTVLSLSGQIRLRIDTGTAGGATRTAVLNK
ncbi:polysaccharide lyase 8 family protein [Streptomyces sp. FIT100]|uniref:polysaccharide lyase 8 family protein n=1 Tax=Streptomyces sp. FIT100 TaxID=2837956 RepID=UPI0021CA39E0|nr:polysaccharide lyase 8 family protein [Streptomyces sp. FIT100]UUN29784.1 polysaccharide lyase 8 family protein [Streptomyces sp. FIT100]